MKFALLAAATLLAASPVTTHATAQATAATSHREPTHAVVLSDEAGDVWTFSDVTLGYDPAVEPAADVLRARVVHGRTVVRIRMVFDNLRRVDTQWYWYRIRTPNAETFRFVLEAKEGHWRGKVWQEIEGEWVRVPGLSHHIDYASDVVTLRVARTLLGQPTWVRVWLRNELGADASTFFTDNPATDSPHSAFTPRLQQVEGA